MIPGLDPESRYQALVNTHRELEKQRERITAELENCNRELGYIQGAMREYEFVRAMEMQQNQDGPQPQVQNRQQRRQLTRAERKRLRILKKEETPRGAEPPGEAAV